MDRILVIRYGAYGDHIIISPVIRALKQSGNHIIFNTNFRGIEMYKNCPHIDQFAPYEDDAVPFDKLEFFWHNLAAETGVDRVINFSQTIEVKLALHPSNKNYYRTKKKRAAQCDKNYYEESMKLAKLESSNYQPELFFSELEENQARQYIRPYCFNIVWCLKGSGINKFYPWSTSIINELGNEKNVNLITVGDSLCRDIENEISWPITKLSGKIPFKISAALTKFADLTISPDTGILHASGCWNKHKIALLGHTSAENITKHFTNCITFESDVPCAPCFSLIYDHKKQKCPIDPITGAVACMGGGIDPNEVLAKILYIYDQWKTNCAKSILGGLLHGNANRNY